MPPSLKSKLAAAEQRINDLQAELLKRTLPVVKIIDLEDDEPAVPTVDGLMVTDTDTPAPASPNTPLALTHDGKPSSSIDEIDAALPDVNDATTLRRNKRIQGEKLTHYEINAILHFHRKGKTQAEIARRLNCTQPTVSNVLRAFTTTKTAAKDYLAANALKLAEDVVLLGDAKTKLKTLEKLGDILKDTKASDTASPVLIGLKINLNDLK